jgi:hypothetical protein
MSRVHTKNTLMSKQLDIATSAFEKLRKMNLPPEAVSVIAEATVHMRRIEQKVDASVNKRTDLTAGPQN